MRKFFSRAFVIAGLLALAACGGGGDGSKFETPGQNGTVPGGSSNAAAITVTSSVPSIASTGGASADITAMVRDANNNLISGVPVTFTATSGGIAITQGTTDTSGQARATLSTAGDSTLRTITVTATTGSLTANVNVQVVAGGGTASAQMGSGTGANFQAGVIGVATPSLSAGGSTSLQIVLQQTDGTLYTQPATITFSSTCIAQGLANVGAPVSTSTGIASATYAAMGCSGADVVTATATVGGQALSATGTITVAAASIGSIVFETATPTNIALRGTGDSSRPEASTVVFRVLDATGGPRAGADVTFSLNTSVGGMTLGPASGQSGTDGRVQTVVQAGTVATTVRVTATVTSITPNIATQSSQLTVTTGIPDQDSFSLAVECPNVEALNVDGVIVGVTARLADRFNNPVPNGTAVTFTTEGGTIQSQCVTATTQTEAGVCSVNWTSSNPRPGGAAPGRSSILATAIGEESFNDANGNGMFDNGETFADMGERFLDADEDGVYDLTEVIYDFNNNSTRDDVDGIFNGVLCNDTSGRCDATRQTTGIGTNTLIIMSGSTPDPVPASGTTLPNIGGAPASRSYTFLFQDVNGNPMPRGTSVSASINGTNLSLGNPTSFTVPCTTDATSYTFTVNAAAGASAGTLTINVTTPRGLSTLLTYPVSP